MLQLHNRWKNSAFKAEPNFNLKVSIKHQIQASVDVGLHLNLGKDPATKSDEFLENFQTAFDPPSFSENYIAIFFYDGYGYIYARRYDGL